MIVILKRVGLKKCQIVPEMFCNFYFFIYLYAAVLFLSAAFHSEDENFCITSVCWFCIHKCNVQANQN